MKLREMIKGNDRKEIDQARKLTKAILSVQSLHVKKLSITKKKLYFGEKIEENKNAPKEDWQTLNFKNF